MNEQSGNITLQDIALGNSREIQSISDLSSIRYEEKYQYLARADIEREHIVLKDISITPERKQYHVRFYQQVEFDTNDSPGKEGGKMLYLEKIASGNIREDKDQETIVRLPSTKKPIAIQVQTQQLLKGFIPQSEYSTYSSCLYNKHGDRMATLAYKLDRVVAKTPTFESEEQRRLQSLNQTLNSKDFERSNFSQTLQNNQEQHLTRIDQELKKTLEHIEEDQRDERQTDRAYEAYSRKIKKRMREDYQQMSEISQCEEGQISAQKIEDRVGLFRNPITYDKKEMARPEISLQSIRRCKQELGLSHIDIESMLLPKMTRDSVTQEYNSFHSNNNNANPQIQGSYLNVLDAVDQHVGKRANQEILNKDSRNIQKGTCGNISSQFKKNNKNYQEFGIETYTPLQSIKTSLDHSERQFRSRSLKSSSHRSATNRRNPAQSPSSRKGKQQQTSQEKAIQIESQLLTLRRQSPKRLFQNSEVYSININHKKVPGYDLPPIPITQLEQKRKPKLWQSCKDTPIHQPSHAPSSSAYEADRQYDIIINNVSIKLSKPVVGCKYIEVSLGGSHYSSEGLTGSNLLWTGTSFYFSGSNPQDQISIAVKCEDRQKDVLLGKVRIKIYDLLINQRQHYYQSLLLSKKEVLGNIIVGYKLISHSPIVHRYEFPRENTSITQSYTEMRRGKPTRRDEDTGRNESVQLRAAQKKKVLSPRLNPIKVKKYLGGKNIRIGRANRFQLGTHLPKPGPGDYEIESGFSRHAVKQY